MAKACLKYNYGTRLGFHSGGRCSVTGKFHNEVKFQTDDLHAFSLHRRCYSIKVARNNPKFVENICKWCQSNLATTLYLNISC